MSYLILAATVRSIDRLAVLWRHMGHLVDLGGVRAWRGTRDPMEAAARAMGAAFGTVGATLAVPALTKEPVSEALVIASSTIAIEVTAHIRAGLTPDIICAVSEAHAYLVDASILTNEPTGRATLHLQIRVVSPDEAMHVLAQLECVEGVLSAEIEQGRANVTHAG